MHSPKLFSSLCLSVILVLNIGCSSMVSSATDRMAGNLSLAILNNDDIDTVAEGLPAYLLLIDGLIQGDPDNIKLLRTGAMLNAAYASAFVNDGKRQQALTAKSFRMAQHEMCMHSSEHCNLRQLDFQIFASRIARLTTSDLPSLYSLGASWASWISSHRDDWNAIAEIAHVKLIMSKVIELDAGYNHAGAHLYMGVLSSLLPSSLGGKPEIGKQHFERALTLTEHQHLMVSVLYARHYARLMFDRQLHDRLLEQVINTQTSIPELTLFNSLAKLQARALLASADDYF